MIHTLLYAVALFTVAQSVINISESAVAVNVMVVLSNGTLGFHANISYFTADLTATGK